MVNLMMVRKSKNIRSEKVRTRLAVDLLLLLFVFFVTPVSALTNDSCNPQDLRENNNCRSKMPDDVSSALAVNYGNMPLAFEGNQGQLEPDIEFMARGSGYNLYLATSSVAMLLYQPPHVTENSSIQKPLPFRLRMKFLDANPDVQINGTDELPGHSNYFVSGGSDF